MTVAKILVTGAALLMAGAGQARATFTTGTFTNSSQIDVTGVFPVAENEAGDLGGLGNGGGTVVLGDVTFVSGGDNSAYFTNFSGSAVVGSTFFAEAELNDLSKALIYKAATSSGNPLTGAIPVTAGQEYKLQLLFHNNDGVAVFNPWSVVVEGDTLTNFQPLNGATQPGQVITYTFTAADSTLNVAMYSQGGPNNDTVYLSAFSLEAVPEPATAGLLLAAAAGTLTLSRRRSKADAM